jgi:hypothetical protein
MVRARETAPVMAVFARKFPAFAAEKELYLLSCIYKSRRQARVGVFYASNLCILEITYII